MPITAPPYLAKIYHKEERIVEVKEIKMFKINADHVICTLVDAMLHRSSPANKGMLISLDCEISDCGKGIKHKSIRRLIHFVFHRPSNYTKVFFGVGNHWEEIKNWKLTSNHDSCWRSDGVSAPLSNFYFTMCEEVNSKKAPMKLESCVYFGLSQSFKFLEINCQLTEDDSHYELEILGNWED